MIANMDYCPTNVNGQLTTCDAALSGGKGLMSLTFREALLIALEDSGKSIPDVARGSGVSKDQLYKVKQRDTASTNLEDAVRVAEYFGKTIDEFLSSPEGSSPHRVSEIYSRLSEEKRLRLEGFAEALLQE